MKSWFALAFCVPCAVAAYAAETPAIDPDLQARAAAPHLGAEDPHWLLDAGSGCWVFDGYPSPNETATWSGACEDKMASGEGTVTWYLGGKVAERRSGTYARGSLNDHGIATMADGSTYEGAWVYGARFGAGELKRANGDVYHGMWPGSGTYTRADGKTCAADARRSGGAVVVRSACASGRWSSP